MKQTHPRPGDFVRHFLGCMAYYDNPQCRNTLQLEDAWDALQWHCFLELESDTAFRVQYSVHQSWRWMTYWAKHVNITCDHKKAQNTSTFESSDTISAFFRHHNHEKQNNILSHWAAYFDQHIMHHRASFIDVLNSCSREILPSRTPNILTL